MGLPVTPVPFQGLRGHVGGAVAALGRAGVETSVVTPSSIGQRWSSLSSSPTGLRLLPHFTGEQAEAQRVGNGWLVMQPVSVRRREDASRVGLRAWTWGWRAHVSGGQRAASEGQGDRGPVVGHTHALEPLPPSGALLCSGTPWGARLKGKGRTGVHIPFGASGTCTFETKSLRREGLWETSPCSETPVLFYCYF